MMKFERLIRKLPTVLVIVAAVDLIKEVLMNLALWHADKFIGSMHGSNTDLDSQFLFSGIERLLGIVIYPLGWVTSAAILTVALSIYDRVPPDA